MKLFYLILSALLLTANAQSDSTTVAPATTTLPPTTASPTTIAPATTTAVTGSSPVPPTTVAPTTALPNTGTPSSVAPDTPTTKASPTTAQPPLPSPYFQNETALSGHYTVNGTNNYCIIIDIAMRFNLTYDILNGNQSYAEFNLPNTSSVAGECSVNNDSNYQIAHLNWGKSNEFTLTFIFTKYSGDKEYGLTNLTLEYKLTDAQLFPNAKTPATTMYVATNRLDGGSGSNYRIDSGGSYLCNANHSIPFPQHKIEGVVNYTTDSDNPLLKSTVRVFKYQAFSSDNIRTYGTYTECSDDFGTNDIVPIAVGCALAALVVIVLIAYLIGRRRSRQKGYQSV